MTPSKKYYRELEKKYGHLKESCRCQICDRVFSGLGYHIKAHGYTEERYKDEFEIMRTVPLVAPDISTKLSKNAHRMIKDGLLAQEIQSIGKARKGKRPLVTIATRKFRRKNINMKISAERRSLIMNLTYANHPEIKKKISNTLKVFYAPLKLKKVCDNCGKDVFKQESKIKNQKHSFCNKKCFFEWQAKIRGMTNENHNRS
jgi:rRNA maturation endonuclease Nob1